MPLLGQLSKRTKMTLWIIAIVAVTFLIYLINAIVYNTGLTMTSYVPTGHYPKYPALNLQDKSPQQMAEIKRGEYLVKAGDCLACHTDAAKGGKPYAGGLPMQTPFGNVYSPNITPDMETGIGKWSDQDFLRAMHEGVSPDGEFYFPAFPYLYFNKITTEDVLAIKAYLNVIPAVKHKNHATEMISPFNWRWLQWFWRVMFFYPERTGEYQHDAKQSAQWNRGAYLAQGLGHCSMCHTPSYYLLSQNVSLGAPMRKYDLTGAVIEGYLAPNISHSNIGAIPDNEMLKVFRKYSMIGGNTVQGPMAEAIHDSLNYLTDEDLLAIITYLKSVKSTVPVSRNVQSTDVGKVIYDNYCSGCHNTGVGGAPRISNADEWTTLANSGVRKLYNVAIHGGGNMPEKGTCITCSNYQIELAVDYIIAHSQKLKKAVKSVK